MEQHQASPSCLVPQHTFDMCSPRGGRGFDRKVHAPFQAIIEKGKQAKAQDEHDQYEARKARREMEIKNAARIRHAEAEANRRRAEESKLSIDNHMGKLLDDMTKNIKAILEDQYREEIRAKVYEDEDRIASAYEHDVKDQIKARLVRELEPVVKAKLGAEFEPEIKQQLAVELISVVKAELRANFETEIKHQLAEELQSGVKAELRAKYEEEIKDQLMTDPEPNIVHMEKGTQTNDFDNEPQDRRGTSNISDEEPFRATPNDIDNERGEYPDLSHHRHLISENGVQNGQQKTAAGQNLEVADANRDAAALPQGTKRSLSGTDNEEENPYARHSKRSRTASFDSEEQRIPSGIEEGSSNLYSNNLLAQKIYQGVHDNGGDNQSFPQYNGDAGYEDARGNNSYKMNHGASGYNSSSEVQESEENILDGGMVGDNGAEDVQGTSGNLSDRDGVDYDGAEDVQGTNGNLSHDEEAEYDRDEDFQGTNGNSPDREEIEYDSAEDFQGRNGYKLVGEANESYSSEENEGEGEAEGEEGDEEEEEEEEEYEEYEEEYESEEDEPYSTAPQAAAHSSVGNGVISFSNTQATAFVLSDDSEDDAEKAGDEDKTLIGYDGPAAFIDAKDLNAPDQGSLFLNG